VSRKAPWLVDRHMLHRAAMRDIAVPALWETSWLPPSLFPIIEERARQTTHEYDLGRLLRWLDEQGLSPSARVDLLIARVALSGRHDWAAAAASLLTDPSAWQSHGARLLGALVSKSAWPALQRLWMRMPLACKQTEPEDSAGLARDLQTIAAAAHEAFAS